MASKPSENLQLSELLVLVASPPTVRLMTAPPRPPGYSLVETAIAASIILVLAAIAVPVFAGATESAQDLQVRQDLDHLAGQAGSRLIRDRAYSYLAWENGPGAVEALVSEDPAVASRLVPLVPGDPAVTEIGRIGVGVTPQGHLLLAALSEANEGDCWTVTIDPLDYAHDVTYSPAGGECPGVAVIG